MGNASKPIIAPTINAPVYTDPGIRTIRQLQTFLFPQTVTSTTTTSNNVPTTLPPITQGTELWNGVFKASSLQSLIEVEANMNFTSGSSGFTFFVGFFADYSVDALCILPAGIMNNGTTHTHILKHFFQPVTLEPVRYSLRFNPIANTVVSNWYQYGGRNASRITFTEYSGPSLQNT